MNSYLTFYSDREQIKLNKSRLSSRLYYKTHKIMVRQKYKIWYDKNKDAQSIWRKSRIMCPCGASICRSYLPRHNRTNKHLKFFNL